VDLNWWQDRGNIKQMHWYRHFSWNNGDGNTMGMIL